MIKNLKYANIGYNNKMVYCNCNNPLENSNSYIQPMMGPLESSYPLDNWSYAKDAGTSYSKRYPPIGYLYFLENPRAVSLTISDDVSYKHTSNFYMRAVLFHNNTDGKIVSCLMGRANLSTVKGYVVGIQMDGSTAANNKGYIGKIALAAGFTTDLKTVNYGSKISNQQRVVLEFLYIDSLLEAYVDGQYIGSVLDRTNADFVNGNFSYFIGSHDHNGVSTTDTQVIVEDLQIIFI